MNIRVCAASVQRGRAIAVATVAVWARKSRRVRADAMIASNMVRDADIICEDASAGNRKNDTG
jgi:hypothetical protein